MQAIRVPLSETASDGFLWSVNELTYRYGRCKTLRFVPKLFVWLGNFFRLYAATAVYCLHNRL